jgi:hypothetical protein
MLMLLTVTAALHISSVVGRKVYGELYFWWVIIMTWSAYCRQITNDGFEHNKTSDLNKRTKSVLDISILREEWIA